jgi:hypothetical protein
MLSRKKDFVVLFSLIVALALFVWSIWVAYPLFQSTRNSDPMAMVNCLPITYFVGVALFSLTCLYVFIFIKNILLVSILLLVTFAVMLWAVPYYFSGYVRLPLGPWKMAQSIRVSDILHGAQIPLSWYAEDYPGSFLFHNIQMSVSGLDPIFYIANVYPALLSILIVVLVFVLISRLFDVTAAFLSVLFMIPGMHYVVLQPAPSSFGLLLFLSSLIFLTFNGTESLVVAAILSMVLVISHPVYAALLVLFVFATAISRLFLKGLKIHASLKFFAVFFAFFMVWELFFVDASRSLFARASGLINLNFISSLFSRVSTRGGDSIFSRIDILNRAVYLIYFLVAAVIVIFLIVSFYLTRSRRRRDLHSLPSGWRRHFGLNSSHVWAIIGILISGITGLFLLLRTPDEAERSLFIFIMLCSALFASAFSRLTGEFRNGRSPIWVRKMSIVLIGIFLASLTIVYPFVAYSIDSYSNFPHSDETGLIFLARSSNNPKILFMFAEGQYLLYSSAFSSVSSDRLVYSKTSQQVSNAITASISKADVVVMRQTGYFYCSVRLDQSFEDNRFVSTEQVLGDTGFNVIFSDPSISIWVKTGE